MLVRDEKKKMIRKKKTEQNVQDISVVRKVKETGSVGGWSSGKPFKSIHSADWFEWCLQFHSWKIKFSHKETNDNRGIEGEKKEK